MSLHTLKVCLPLEKRVKNLKIEYIRHTQVENMFISFERVLRNIQKIFLLIKYNRLRKSPKNNLLIDQLGAALVAR